MGMKGKQGNSFFSLIGQNGQEFWDIRKRKDVPNFWDGGGINLTWINILKLM